MKKNAKQSPVAICERYIAEFEPIVQRVAPQHSSVLPSELLLFWSFCRERGVTLIAESGRRYGYSTEILAHGPWRVVSIDNNPDDQADARLKQYDNLELVYGSGEKHVPRLIGTSTAVLLDGPKGPEACEMSKEWQCIYAIHDVYPGTPIRDELQDAVLSDSPEFVARFGYLDAETLAYRGYETHVDLLSAANVLAVMNVQ